MRSLDDHLGDRGVVRVVSLRNHVIRIHRNLEHVNTRRDVRDVDPLSREAAIVNVGPTSLNALLFAVVVADVVRFRVPPREIEKAKAHFATAGDFHAADIQQTVTRESLEMVMTVTLRELEVRIVYG